MSYVGAMLIALVIDALAGWPDRLTARIGHPVTWIGRLITSLDTALNHDTDTPGARRKNGVIAALAVIGVAAVLALLAQLALPDDWRGTLIAGALAWPLIAARSMFTHVADVERPLAAEDLEGARAAVSRIVGRDPKQLDQGGVARAAIESLAENTSDGVIAPLFWGAVLGLPGIAAYKAINTLDSMIGHRTSRHESFGWASARVDDYANYIPARLTALLFAFASGVPGKSLNCVVEDARSHRSPNAGWPESAMAGALDIRLSGPRVYHDRTANEPWINGAGREPGANDIRRGLDLYVRAVAGLAIVLAAIFAVRMWS